MSMNQKVDARLHFETLDPQSEGTDASKIISNPHGHSISDPNHPLNRIRGSQYGDET